MKLFFNSFYKSLFVFCFCLLVCFLPILVKGAYVSVSSQFQLVTPLAKTVSYGDLVNKVFYYQYKSVSGATGKTKPGSYYCSYITAAKLYSPCASGKTIAKVESTYSSTRAGKLYCFKADPGYTFPCKTGDKSFKLSDTLFTMNVVTGSNLSPTFSYTSGQAVYFVYIPSSDPLTNGSYFVNPGNTSSFSLVCCTSPSLSPLGANDGCGTDVALSSNAVNGLYCSGTWQYAWQNTSTGKYWSGSSFSSSTAVYSASYLNINTTQGNGSTTYKSLVRCSADNTCVKNASIAVAVTEAVIPDLAELIDKNICSDQEISLTASLNNESPNITYTWTGVYSGVGQTANFTPDATGTLTVVAANNCGDYDSKTINVNVFPSSSSNKSIEINQSSIPFYYDDIFPSINASVPGTTEYVGHTTNAIGCDSTITLTVVVKQDVLPVEWDFFKLRAENANVLLEWQTMSETNCSHFEIEKSLNGSDFQIIGVVNGSVNSNSAHYYNYIDSKAEIGISYYRLKQVDFDGVYEYTSARSFTNTNFSNEFYVNSIFTDDISILSTKDFSEPLYVDIYDVQGKKVLNVENLFFGSDKRILIKAESLDEGLYFMHIKGRNLEKNIKIIKKSL